MPEVKEELKTATVSKQPLIMLHYIIVTFFVIPCLLAFLCSFGKWGSAWYMRLLPHHTPINGMACAR